MTTTLLKNATNHSIMLATGNGILNILPKQDIIWSDIVVSDIDLPTYNEHIIIDYINRGYLIKLTITPPPPAGFTGFASFTMTVI
jgi:hypothetical protein